MESIWNTHFLVIDVETTGYSPTLHSLIDVACVSLLRENIVGRFSSLINPHLPIPPIIRHLTHITNEMVATAPEEYEVLLQLRDILLFPNAVFVAHNVAFDYPFVKGAYEKEGIDFPQIDKLCTLKLARRLLKKELKKNVGDLSTYFGYKVKDRHRALGDANATAFILNKLLHIAEEEHGITTREELLELQNTQIKNYVVAPSARIRLAPFIENIPTGPGIFRFKNKDEQVHFIGTATNLCEQLKTNFLTSKLTSRKLQSMIRKSYSLEFSETNSVLEAELLAARETSELSPYYNGRKDKLPQKEHFIKLNTSYDFPNLEIANGINDIGVGEYFGPYVSEDVCEKIYDAAEKYFPVRKCQNAKLKIDPNGFPCIYHSFKQCPAPCCGFISQEEYGRGIADLRNYLSGSPDGIISKLEEKMHRYADNLEFEKAQAVKIQIEILRTVPQHTNDVERDTLADTSEDNFLLVLPVDERGKIVQILLFAHSVYQCEHTIGIKAPLEALEEIIASLYFASDDSDAGNEQSTRELINKSDMSIVKSFMSQNEGKFAAVYIDGKTQPEIIAEITAAIRNFYSRPTEDTPTTEISGN